MSNARRDRSSKTENGKAVNQKLSINAMPTKELFVNMLTRDVSLIPAILDLTDNCTDSARAHRKGSDDWTGLSISLNLSRDSFEIADNCGGMSVKAAQERAFRFGRLDSDNTVQNGVGRFGVGMKRGLFKIGEKFVIKSQTQKEAFGVTIDVKKWLADPKNWEFRFDEEPKLGNFKETFFRIRISALHDRVGENFANDIFVQQLRDEIESKFETALKKGMNITVNSYSLRYHARKLLGGDLAPAKRSFKTKSPLGGEVGVELLCGLGKPENKSTARAESGWYVFCNGRMLLQADKSTLTGWGIEETDSLPNHHQQYNDFRGLAYLEAGDAADLPWNTTKTALDIDHPVYQKVRQEMIALARPVITFINQRKKENQELKEAGQEAVGPLQKLFDKVKPEEISQLKTRRVFQIPQAENLNLKKEKDQLISFKVDRVRADKVKKELGESTWQKVGEKIFDYYYGAEIE